MPSDYFAVLAQHSAWANRRLFRACGSLSAADYLRERASTFGSLHATLNQILGRRPHLDRSPRRPHLAAARRKSNPLPRFDRAENRLPCRGRAAPPPDRRSVRGDAGSTAAVSKPARRPLRDADPLCAGTPLRSSLRLPRRGAGVAGACRGSRACPRPARLSLRSGSRTSRLAGFPRFASNFMEGS